MKRLSKVVVILVLAGLFIYGLGRSWGGVPAIGPLLDPHAGVYGVARIADAYTDQSITFAGLRSPVIVVRDERSVPHIFAESDLDAVAVLGYQVAQDRLFQLDFISRVAAGRLSEVLGPSMVETDRFLRETGMEWGAEKNFARIQEEDGIELALLKAYAQGVNAYIESMSDAALPLEFRLLGYTPERFTEMHILRVLQYMTFDLTFRSNEQAYTELYHVLGEDVFTELFPEYADVFVPIIPEKGGRIPSQERRAVYDVSNGGPHVESAVDWLEQRTALVASLQHTVAEGFIDGKGSNNWAIGPGRSTHGAAIIAGDMHLSLWLPSIWYEAHLVTPSMNTYGVTIPGAPLLVEAYNDYLGWAFTNTGADQIDYLALTLDESGKKYIYEGEHRALTIVSDTLHVKGASPIVEERYFSHWGPVSIDDGSAVAVQWVAHGYTRTLEALWRMNRAQSMEAFQEALKSWQTPMQNIIYGDIAGNIAIRSTGALPIRRGRQGIGVLDGASRNSDWTGYVAFEDLPFSFNPPNGYLTSTNQQPADSTYPFYQGYDWGPGYRSLRIDALLSGKEKHSLEDLKRYQSDVYVVQRDMFVPLLSDVRGLSEKALVLKRDLENWEGMSHIDRVEPLIFDIFLDHLNNAVWDEEVFIGTRRPKEDRLYALLNGDLPAVWLDMVDTEQVEDAEAVLKHVLEKTVETLEYTYGWDRATWRWGDHHAVVFKHYTRSDALKALWRGPYEFPGFAQTLSPAANRETTHSASWRMVVDFSDNTATGYGVYPGGQSGNPFSVYYDKHIPTYLAFDYYKLKKPARPEELPSSEVIYSTVFNP